MSGAIIAVSGPSGAVPDLACVAAELEWAALDFVYALGALGGPGVTPDAGTAAQRALHAAALAYARAGGYRQIAASYGVDDEPTLRDDLVQGVGGGVCNGY